MLDDTFVSLNVWCLMTVSLLEKNISVVGTAENCFYDVFENELNLSLFTKNYFNRRKDLSHNIFI